MNTYKNCENCSHLRHEREKYLCGKIHFVSVAKQEFFYDPIKEKEAERADRNPFYLNKYISLSNAIECEDYNQIDFKVISEVYFEDMHKLLIEKRGRYGRIYITVLDVLKNTKKEIQYENMSYGSKTRSYFTNIKRYIDMQKEFCGNIMQIEY